MNEARLSHLSFWGPSEAFFFFLTSVGLTRMKCSPRLTQGFTRTLYPTLEGFIRVNPTAVELIRKKPSLGPQNGKLLKRALFIGSPSHVASVRCVLYVRVKGLGLP